MAKSKRSINIKLPKNKIVLSVSAFAIVLAVFIGVFSYGIYNQGWEGGATRSVAKIIPFPAASVGGSWINFSAYLDEVDILKDYHQDFKSVDFSTDEGAAKLAEIKDTTLYQMIEDVVIKKEASRLGVIVTNDEFEASFKDLLESNGGEDKVKENLDKYYNNMSIAAFKEQYRKKMLRAKLSEKITEDESLHADSKKKATDLLAQINSGEDFATLATANTDDTASATTGGDLGFFGKGKMVPEFETAAFALKKGQVSEVVKTVYGYHIIKVTDTKGEEIQVSHILIKTQDFNEWLTEKVEESQFKQFFTPGA